MPLLERLKSTFIYALSPTGSDSGATRNELMVDDLRTFAQDVKEFHKQFSELGRSVSDRLNLVAVVLDNPLPRTFQDGPNGARPIDDVRRIGMHVPRAGVEKAKIELEERLQRDVISKLGDWIEDYRAAKAAHRENLRLLSALNEQRHFSETLTEKAIKQQETSHKDAHATMTKAKSEQTRLQDLQQRYKIQERSVYEQLRALIRRSDRFKDAMLTTLRCFQVTFTSAYRAFEDPRSRSSSFSNKEPPSQAGPLSQTGPLSQAGPPSTKAESAVIMNHTQSLPVTRVILNAPVSAATSISELPPRSLTLPHSLDLSLPDAAAGVPHVYLIQSSEGDVVPAKCLPSADSSSSTSAGVPVTASPMRRVLAFAGRTAAAVAKHAAAVTNRSAAVAPVSGSDSSSPPPAEGKVLKETQAPGVRVSPEKKPIKRLNPSSPGRLQPASGARGDAGCRQEAARAGGTNKTVAGGKSPIKSPVKSPVKRRWV